MSGGSFSGKGFSKGKGKAGKKGPAIVWEGSLGPDFFPEAVFEFPEQSKREFTKQTPLKGYDNRTEEWPKCMYGEECLVQMCTDGMDGGRRFFKCPRAWVTISINFIYIFFELSL